MIKSKPKRKQVRPVEQVSMMDKRFKPVVKVSTRVNQKKIHPVMVLIDLRKGSLVSLGRYLAQEKWIPDREVALELRKLISGSVHRSRYRLFVEEHPDRQKDKGGRPRKTDKTTFDRQLRLVASYEKALRSEGKAYLARERVSAEFECDDSTVKRAIRKVRQAQLDAHDQRLTDESFEQRSAKAVDLRRSALAKWRKGAEKKSD